MSVLGLNILGDRGIAESTIMQDAALTGRAVHVVMNAPALARSLAAAGNTVIYRKWGDDNAHTQGAVVVEHARSFVETRLQEAPPNSYIYLTNEPAGDYERLNEWTLHALRRLEQAGRRGCILNMATGNPEPPVWDVLAPCIQAAVRGGHLIGHHDYFDRRVSASTPWHVGRWIPAKQRLGGQWVITELGCAVDYDPYDGWQDYMTADDYAAQLGAAGEIYHREGVFACVFCYGDWPARGRGNFHTTRPIIESMGRFNRSKPAMVLPNPTTAAPPATPPPTPPAASDPRWQPGDIIPDDRNPQTVTDAVNLRANAGTNHAVLTTLRGRNSGARIVDAAIAPFVWLRVGNLIGAAHSDYFRFEAAPTTSPPVALYAPLTADEMQQLATLHTSIASIYRAAVNRASA